MTMRLTIGEIAGQVRAEGLAEPDDIDALRATLAREAEDDIPWYMRAAVGAGAWAATVFLLVFLFGLQLLRDDTTRIVVGIVLVAIALRARRTASAEFMRQASVAASLAGEGLIIVGTGALADSGVVAGIVGLVLSVAMVVLMPDWVHRFLSTLIGAGCAVVVVLDFDWRAGLEVLVICLAALTALVWRTGVREGRAAPGETAEPVGYGLLVAAFIILLYSEASGGRISPLHDTVRLPGAATTVVVGAMLIALVSTILRESAVSLSSPASLLTLAAIVLLTAITRTNPGIIAGVAVLVLGFDRRNPLLIGMAALFLTVFGSVYYYSLSLTLMGKAGVLAASGIVIVVAAAVIARGTSESLASMPGGAR